MNAKAFLFEYFQRYIYRPRYKSLSSRKTGVFVLFRLKKHITIMTKVALVDFFRSNLDWKSVHTSRTARSAVFSLSLLWKELGKIITQLRRK